MKNSICPMCGCSEYINMKKYENNNFEQQNYRIVRCKSCGHTFTNISEDIDLDKLYSSGNYKILDTRKTLFDRILAIDDKMIVNQLNKLNTLNNSLLDFGCGKGVFIHRAQKYGWKVKGIEVAKERAEFGICKYGLDISTEEYVDGEIKDAPFGVITLFHVLEHLASPKEMLKELLEHNLASDGYLVLEVPLFDSLQSRLGGKRWLHLDLPLHLSHFTKSSILELIQKLNLEPVKYQYSSIHLGLLGMVQSIMSLFGYRKMIISELKFRRTSQLVALILLVLPIAFFLEVLAVCFKKGGIIRVYCKKSI